MNGQPESHPVDHVRPESRPRCARAQAAAARRDGLEVPSAVFEERAICALWDLDNVNTRRRYLPQLADALSGVVGPEAFRVAAAQRITFRSSRAMLNEHGFEVLSGGRRANGADRQLLARARVLRRQGVKRFVLISNDGDLARIARLGELVVITPNAAQLSARLVAVASQVRELMFEHGHWIIRLPKPRVDDPSPAEGAASTSATPRRTDHRHPTDVDVEG